MNARPVAWLLAACLSLVCSAPINARDASAPPTERRPVSATYHGVEVSEDYRWLEDPASAEVQEWTRRQNERTRQWVESPRRTKLRAKLEEWSHGNGATYRAVKRAGAGYLALKDQPPSQQALLVWMDQLREPLGERVVVDPAALDASGSTAILGFFPSYDGRRVAIMLTRGGSEQGELRIYETATGRALPDTIERVMFATGGGSVAWERDGSGFFYTRYPRAGERPPEDESFYEQAYHHRLGADPATDTYILGRDFPKIAEVFFQMREDGRQLLITVQRGDGGEFAHWMRSDDGTIRQLYDFADGVKSIVFGPNDSLFCFTRAGAPRGKIIRVPLADLSQERVIVPESEAVIEGYSWRGLEIVPNFVLHGEHLWVTDVVGGPSQVRLFDLGGGGGSTLPLPEVASIENLSAAGPGEVLMRVATYLEPPAWYLFDGRSGQVTRTALAEQSPIHFDDAVVVREMAASADGTLVPLSIIHRRGLKLNGRNPVLLTGYGGYGVNLTPEFLGRMGRAWLDEGGVYVVANLRGGGEFGEAWHEAGRLVRKQNVFDDFVGCARHLVARRYTRPSRLAIMGGSNGGLLMGAVLTQHPELFRAVVSYVGIYDMLRVELEPNGAFNVPEFGTVEDPEQFRALYAYSPYHRVKDGVRYPSVMFLTGENDKRVNPLNSRKMTARLQAATASRHPILLQVKANAGHGQGTALSDRLDMEADVLSFLFRELRR